MKLEEFVRQTLLDITNGVVQAQNSSKLWIAPGLVENKRVDTPQMVSFEVAVTVNKEAGGGINVWSLGNVKANGGIENFNKIQFEVPVYFHAPTDLNKKHYSKKNKSLTGADNN